MRRLTSRTAPAAVRVEKHVGKSSYNGEAGVEVMGSPRGTRSRAHGTCSRHPAAPRDRKRAVVELTARKRPWQHSGGGTLSWREREGTGTRRDRRTSRSRGKIEWRIDEAKTISTDAVNGQAGGCASRDCDEATFDGRNPDDIEVDAPLHHDHRGKHQLRPTPVMLEPSHRRKTPGRFQHHRDPGDGPDARASGRLGGAVRRDLARTRRTHRHFASRRESRVWA